MTNNREVQNGDDKVRCHPLYSYIVKIFKFGNKFFFHSFSNFLFVNKLGRGNIIYILVGTAKIFFLYLIYSVFRMASHIIILVLLEFQRFEIDFSNNLILESRKNTNRQQDDFFMHGTFRTSLAKFGPSPLRSRHTRISGAQSISIIDKPNHKSTSLAAGSIHRRLLGLQTSLPPIPGKIIHTTT